MEKINLLGLWLFNIVFGFCFRKTEEEIKVVIAQVNLYKVVADYD